ncbi:MAG TPA: FAD-linked oxidase C-terminal domain-containing protein, partial [Jiangellaceae bacterium]
DPAEGELLLEARRVVLLALERLGTTLIDDVCVPLSRLADLFDGVEKIAASYGVLIGVVGHAGDGNMHPTVVFDASDADQARQAQRAFGAVMDLGLELGGTITGEHGVGILKKEWLQKELGPVGLRLHQDIKRVLDPFGILNPGKVFD